MLRDFHGSSVNFQLATSNEKIGGSHRPYETFSKQHREQLAIGSVLTTASSHVRKSPAKARITVVVRKRPLTNTEALRNETDIISLNNDQTTISVGELRKNVCGSLYVEPHEFVFDKAYSECHSNLSIYRSCVRKLVDAVFEQGARCSCFAYGQTGSGKTYTMVGPGRLGVKPTLPDKQGLVELAARDCFKWLEKPELNCDAGVYVSFFEVYCNRIYDLLNHRQLVKALETKTSGEVVVKNLTCLKATNSESFLKVVCSGLDQRVVGSNSKNTDSSRGHAILTLDVRNEHSGRTCGKLAFIDLAGSERGADAMVAGKVTQMDGAGINRSLLALKECIRALDQQSTHVPFRDSELTKVLRDMFIGTKTRTLMISCVSPSSSCCEQTLNTLRYADRVKAIRRFSEPQIAEDAESVNGEYQEFIQDDNSNTNMFSENQQQYFPTTDSDNEVMSSTQKLNNKLRQKLGFSQSDNNKKYHTKTKVYEKETFRNKESNKLPGGTSKRHTKLKSTSANNFLCKKSHKDEDNDSTLSLGTSHDSITGQRHRICSENSSVFSGGERGNNSHYFRKKDKSKDAFPSTKSGNSEKQQQSNLGMNRNHVEKKKSFLGKHKLRSGEDHQQHSYNMRSNNIINEDEESDSRSIKNNLLDVSDTQSLKFGRKNALLECSGASRLPTRTGQLTHRFSTLLNTGPKATTPQLLSLNGNRDLAASCFPHYRTTMMSTYQENDLMSLKSARNYGKSNNENSRPRPIVTSTTTTTRDETISSSVLGIPQSLEQYKIIEDEAQSSHHRRSTTIGSNNFEKQVAMDKLISLTVDDSRETKKTKNRLFKTGDSTINYFESLKGGDEDKFQGPSLSMCETPRSLKHLFMHRNSSLNMGNTEVNSNTGAPTMSPARLERKNLQKAASILRKRYNELNFPLIPQLEEKNSHISPVSLETAIKMIQGLTKIPSKDIYKFYDRYSRKYEQLYKELLGYHKECLRGQEFLSLRQHRMVQNLQKSDTIFAVDVQYLEGLRRIVRSQMSMYIRLGKRLTEIEKMQALQDQIYSSYQKVKLSEKSARNPDEKSLNLFSSSKNDIMSESLINRRGVSPPRSAYNAQGKKNSVDSDCTSIQSPNSFQPVSMSKSSAVSKKTLFSNKSQSHKKPSLISAVKHAFAPRAEDYSNKNFFS